METKILYIGSKIAIPYNSHHASALYSARALSACRLKRACKYSSTFTVKVYFNFINTIKNVFSIMLPPNSLTKAFVFLYVEWSSSRFLRARNYRLFLGIWKSRLQRGLPTQSNAVDFKTWRLGKGR